MKAIAIPASKFVEFWAQNASGSFVRAIPTTTATPGAASLDQGFPPVTATPVASGGIPPDIRDFNGAYRIITQWEQSAQAGGALIAWDATFSAAIGGYPNGAVVLSATTPGAYYVSTLDDNPTNPDAAGANWVPGSLYGSLTTGDVKMSYKTTPDVGFIPMNDGSIGSGASGATTRQNADTQPLFSLMYNNMTDAWAPIQTSTGSPTTRGAQGSAAAAFAANCRLVLPAMLGRAIAVAGSGSGLTARALGQTFGEEAHTIVANELPPHVHPVQPAAQSGARGPGPGDALGANTGSPTTGNNSTTNTPANVMQPTSFLNPFVKL